MRLALDLLNQRRSIGLPPDEARFDIDLLSVETVVDSLVKRSFAVEGDENLRDLNAPVLVHHGLQPVYVKRQLDVGPANRIVVRFVVVSGEEARDDKDLDLLGVDWTGYDLNPVWMRSHQWDEPPLGRVLRRQVYKRGGSYELWKDVEFTPEDIYPLGALYGRMHADGWMRACSGSWLGKRIKVVRGQNGAPQRVQYLLSDWMESSSCSVPVDRFSIEQQVERGLLSAEIANRLQVEARAYNVQGDPMKKRKEAGKHAFKAGEQRTVIEDKKLENPFEEEYAAASRAMDAAHRAGPAVACPSCGAANEGQNQNCRECSADMAGAQPVAPAGGEGGEATGAADGAATGADGGEGAVAPGDAGSGTGDDAGAAGGEGGAAGDGGEGGAERSTPASVVFRGPVMDALDPAVDALLSSIVILANVADELRSLCFRGFYENRSMTPVQLEAVLRDQFERTLPDMVSRYAEIGPAMMGGEQMPEFTDYLDRQVNRGEAALSSCGHALSEVRDAIALYGDAIVMQAAGASPNKGQDAWRKRVESAMALTEQTLANLRTVVDEGPPEPEPEPEKEDPKSEGDSKKDGEDGQQLSDAEQMQQDLKQKARALDETLSAAIARRDQPILGALASASERLAATLAARAVKDEAPPAAAEPATPVDVEVVTSLGSRLDEAIARRAAKAPPAAATPAEEPAATPPRTQRAVRAYPGIKLPRRVAERLGLPSA